MPHAMIQPGLVVQTHVRFTEDVFLFDLSMHRFTDNVTAFIQIFLHKQTNSYNLQLDAIFF